MPPGSRVVYGAGADPVEPNVDIGSNFFTVSGSTRASAAAEGVVFHALGITPDHPGCGDSTYGCIPGDNWVTLEVVDGAHRVVRGHACTGNV